MASNWQQQFEKLKKRKEEIDKATSSKEIKQISNKYNNSNLTRSSTKRTPVLPGSTSSRIFNNTSGINTNYLNNIRSINQEILGTNKKSSNLDPGFTINSTFNKNLDSGFTKDNDIAPFKPKTKEKAKVELSKDAGKVNAEGYTDTGRRYGHYFYQDYATKGNYKIYSKDDKYYVYNEKTKKYEEITKNTGTTMTTREQQKKDIKEAEKLGYKKSDSDLTVLEQLKLDTANLTAEEYKDYEEDLLRQKKDAEKKAEKDNKVRYGGAGLKGSLGELEYLFSNAGSKVKEGVINPVRDAGENYEYGKMTEQLGLEAYKKMQGEENNYDEIKKKHDKFIKFNQDIVQEGNYLDQTVQTLPNQIGGQVAGIKKAGPLGTIGAGGGALIGFLATKTPTGATTGAKIGAKLLGGGGYVTGQAEYTYQLEAGLQYQTLIEMGVPEEIAKKEAEDTGKINALIESGESILDLISLGQVSKVKSVLSTRLLKEYGEDTVKEWLGKTVVKNAISEGTEELSQEAVSIHNEKQAMEQAGLERDDSQDAERLKQAGIGGALSGGLMAGGTSVVVGGAKTGVNTVKQNQNNKTTQAETNITTQEVATNNETELKRQNFVPEVTENDSEIKRNLYDSASKVMNNTARSHEFVDLVSKIAEDKQTQYLFTNTEQLQSENVNLQGKTVNGLVRTTQDGKTQVLINIDSNKALNSILGHETTHLLEGTAEYQSLQQAVFEYAKTKGEYDSRYQELSKLYEGTNANIENELTSDLVGDYIFTDVDFVNKLAVEKPTVFQKVYDYIKHVYKMVTAGSKEAKQLEQAKYNFEQAYKNNLQSKQDTKYAISENVETMTEEDAIETMKYLSSVEETRELNRDEKDLRQDIINKYLLQSDKFSDYLRNWLNEKHTKNIAEIEEVKNNKANIKRYDFKQSNIQGLENYKESDIEDAIFKDIDNKLSQYGYGNEDVEIDSIYLHGSRKRGTAKIDSDLDVVLFYTGEADDVGLFNDLNENRLNIGGVEIDVNPINLADESAESYISRSEAYDKEVLSKEGTKYSLSEDNQGRTLTKEQQEFFKDSKVRDENGNLLTVYHGTDNDFTVFERKPGKRNIGGLIEYEATAKGFFFSTDKKYASEYGNKVKEYYLNITNPLFAPNKTYTDTEITDIQYILQPLVDEDVKNGDLSIVKYDDGSIMYRSDSLYRHPNNIWERYASKETGIDWEHTDSEIFDDVIKRMKEKGYDGTYVDELQQNSEGKDISSIFVINSNQIKNIDNTNPTSDPDIRYSLSKPSFEQTQKAIELEKQNKTQEEIYLETGVYTGADGKLRAEIDDSKAKIIYDKPYTPGNTPYKLSDILKHDLLYKAYPEFKDLKVTFGDLGSYNGAIIEDGSIALDSSLYNPNEYTKKRLKKYLNDLDTDVASLLWTQEEIDKMRADYNEKIKNYNATSYQEALKSTLMHEIQHKIQEKEGFAKGTNVEKAKEIHVRYVEKIRELNTKLSDLYEKSGVNSDWVKENITRVQSGEITIDEFFEEQKQARLNSKYGEQIKSVQEEKDDYVRRFSIYDQSGYDLYMNTAGEIEAREVQKRLNYTPKQRKAEMPFTKDEKTVFAEPSLNRKFGIVQYSLTPDYGMQHRPSTDYGDASNFEENMPDVFEHPEWYFYGGNDARAKRAYRESFEALKKVRNNPEGEITIYRATIGDSFNEGDWVTPSKTYAEWHNESNLDGKGKVIKLKVKAKDIRFAGDDLNEFGYFPNGVDDEYSLSNQNDIAPTKDPNLTYSEDVKLQVEEAIAPIKEEINNLNENIKNLLANEVPETEQNIAPIEETVTTESTQPTKEELDNLEQIRLNKSGSAYALEFFRLRDKYGQVKLYKGLNEYKSSPETYKAPVEKATNTTSNYKALTEADLPMVEQQYEEAFKNITDNDAPIEVDNTIPEDEVTPTKSLFETRDYEDVGDRKVNAYQYDNPEVKPFFQQEAQYMLDDLRNSIKGQKYYNDELYYETSGQEGFYGTTRQTTQDIAELLDGIDGKYKYTYADIEKGLNAIIEDKGSENIAVSKRIEFYLDQRLRDGYIDLNGNEIPSNEGYVNVLKAKEMTDFYSNIPITDDMIPVENASYTENSLKNVPISSEKASKNTNIPLTKKVAENTNKNDLGYIPLNPTKESSYDDARIQRDPLFEYVSTKANKINKKQVQKALKENEAKVTKGKFRQTTDTLKYLFTNRNVEIDNLAHETGNLNIKYAGDMLNNVQGEIEGDLNVAQTNTEGKAIGKSIAEIFKPSKKAGLYEAFNDYLVNKSNIERHKQGKGSVVPLNVSHQLVHDYEKTYPEFKEWAKDVYKYNRNILNNEVEAGLVSKDLADRLTNDIYPSYVPFYEDRNLSRYFDDNGDLKPVKVLKRAKGGAGNLLHVEDSMIKQTSAYKKAIRQNELYQQIVETLGNTVDIGADVRQDPTQLNESLYVDENGNKYLTAYIDGEQKTVKISDSLYNGLNNKLESQIKDIENKLPLISKPLQAISEVRRNLLTTWSPSFFITNPLKDIQDAPLNSKYTKDFALYYPTSAFELAQGKTELARQFKTLYGSGNTMGEFDLNTMATKGKNIPFLRNVQQINNILELAPRFAEFKASIKNGASIQEAMYNAREVTTNFGRGGVITRALNKNGFTFLNASTQGFSKFIRNFSGENGAKGVVNSLIKATMLGVAPALYNALAFGQGEDQDEEYKALPDYIKDTYYIIKTGDGEFIRIPKGRMMSVFGMTARRVLEYADGEEDAFKGLFESAYNQVGVANPIDNNIFAPLIQAKNNEAWYGGDIVPSRLQDKPAEEQYDETTDEFSKWLGELINVSPYKINYVVDQYSGGIGDLILPTITEEATSDGSLLAPLKDKFTANSVSDNKYVSDFYTKSEELSVKSNSNNATEEDILKSKYMYAISSEMSKLYAERREVQSDSSLSKEEKYEKSQAIKREINRLAEQGLNGYEKINKTDTYAIIDDQEFYKNAKGQWYEPYEDELGDLNLMGMEMAEKSNYYRAKNEIYNIQQNYDDDSNSYHDRKVDIINAIQESGLNNDQMSYLYDKYYASSETLDMVNKIGVDFNEYLNYEKQEFVADKDEDGKSISGSKKAKVFDYINTMDIEFEQRVILAKLQYNSYDEYNYEIIDYLNNLDTITYEEEVEILKKLGFEVDADGGIRW